MKTKVQSRLSVTLQVTSDNAKQFHELLESCSDSTNSQVQSFTKIDCGNYVEFTIRFTDVLSVWQVSSRWTSILK